MKRAVLRNLSLYTRNLLSPQTLKPTQNVSSPIPSLSSTCSKFRFYSSEDDSSNKNPKPLPETSLAQLENKDAIDVEDVSNKELKLQLEEYFKGNEEAALPSIFEAILKRKVTGKHEDTDDDLLDELQLQPLDDVQDKEFESDFEELYETDEEIDNLYNARQIVEKRLMHDEYFNMDDRKWDEMIKEATEKGFLKDTGECERILEDMLSWDKLLPGTYILVQDIPVVSRLPDPVKSILEEGINLYNLHTKRHGRLESTKGTYAKDWAKWEKQLREILSGNAEYLNSIQVPFELAVKQVLEQLRTIAKGDYKIPSTEKRKFGSIVFAAVSLPVSEIQSLLDNVAKKNPEVEAFLKGDVNVLAAIPSH